MAYQCWALWLAVLAGVASSDSTTSLRGAVLAEEGCRLAVKGEECYEHVEWAMKHGITSNPEWYPGLTPNSTFEEFQVHLHNSNHGNCPEPCPSPQPSPAPAKKQCCGRLGCQPYNPEYDPVTEQCCGEGEYINSPTVCSKDSGCCLSDYTGYPKCFDRGSQKCCGVNKASDMPVVCSLDVACPPQSDSWRQCPSAGAAAAAANSSRNGPGIR